MSDDEAKVPGHLWAVVQEWLDSLGIYKPSQRQLAGKIKVSASTLSSWKYGEAFPDPEPLRRLADEIGVPYERVLDAVLRDHGYRFTPVEKPDVRKGNTA